MNTRTNSGNTALFNLLSLIGIVIVAFLAISNAYAQNANVARKNPNPRTMVLVDNGKALAVIVKPDATSKEVDRAIEELRKSVKEITGVDLAIKASNEIAETKEYVRIHVGANKIIQDKLPDLKKCTVDGAWIVTPTPRDLVIVGSTPTGTEYGVYGFLQNYCGVRWFLPGKNGKFTPVNKKLAIPGKINSLDNPFFTSRMFSAPTFWGLKLMGKEASKIDIEWFRHNRLKRTSKIHHSLWKVIDPRKYAKEHPEYFPDKHGNGKRFIPPLKGKGLQIGWQPCMSNDEVIDIAAKAAIDFFDKKPNEKVFSLAVNDHCGFCRCAKCKQVNKGKNVLGTNGLLSYSNLYFSFVNKVAEKVSEKYPDRYIGCLAYAWCRDYPDFKIHPQVAVMYTMNSDGNFDAVNRNDMLQVFKYADTCGAFGVYTYLYGKGYKIPVMWTGLLDDFINKLASRNTKWFYAETYQNWGMDGIKYYLLAQKLWDPSKSFSKMLDDFCDTMFDGGADKMKRFFEICRLKWENQPFTTVGSYSSLVGSSQKVLFDSATCDNLLTLLRDVKNETANPKGRALCDMFILNITYSRALAALQEQQLKLLDKGKMSVEDVLKAFALVKEVEQTYDNIKGNEFSAFRILRGKALPGGVLSHLQTIAAPFFIQCLGKKNENERITTFFEGIKNEPESTRKSLKTLYDFFQVAKGLPELIENPGFEAIESDKKSAVGWKNGTWAGKGPIENIFIVPQAASGAYCYYLNGIKHTMGYYPRPMIENKGQIPIQGNKRYVLRGKMKFTRNEVAGVFPQGTVYIAFSNKNKKRISATRVPIPTGRRWFDAVWVINSPANAANIKLTFLPLQGIGEAWLDDLSLKEIPSGMKSKSYIPKKEISPTK